MKPKITWEENSYGDKYWFCQLPDEAESTTDDRKEWHIWSCCGVGITCQEAYEDWAKDCASFDCESYKEEI